MSTPVIDGFRDGNRFLSNFWASPAAYDGVVYPTAEHAYQAAKTADPALREEIRRAPKPFDAKQLGAAVTPVPGWSEGGDVAAMSEVLATKFRLNRDLAARLLATGDAVLIEGNHWHDNNWGSCTCGAPDCAAPGRNKLGHALMTLRAVLAAEKDIRLPFTPVKVVRSAQELKGLAFNSVVCAAWVPADAFQYSSPGDDTWCETGADGEFTSEQLWAYCTEPYIGMVPDSEREVWVLWDGASQSVRPPRPAGTPDWAFTADPPGRSVTSLHLSREDAAADLGKYADGPDGRDFPGRLWRRPEGKHVFYRVNGED